MNETNLSKMTDASPPQPGVGYLLALRVALIAGVFAAIVCTLLLYDYSQRIRQHPLDSAAFLAMKDTLNRDSSDKASKDPVDESHKEKIRQADLKLRSEYFRQREFTRFGALLLLAAVAVCVGSSAVASTLNRKLPIPAVQGTPRDVEMRWTRIGRWAVAGVGLALVATTVVLSQLPSDVLKHQQELAEALDPDPSPTPAGDNGEDPLPPDDSMTPPTEEEIARMWGRFRGPSGAGISNHADIPTTFNGTTGDGVRWKSPVPLPGMNSPIVAGKRVFLCGADKEHREVYCYDADSGTLRWKKEVRGDPDRSEEEPDPEFSGYAAPTMATNGRQVFAIFSSGEMAAFDFGGNQLWTKNFGYPDNAYGHASSLETYGDLVFVQIDQGSSIKKTKSKLYAMDGATGNIRWEVDRPVLTSWTSPTTINHDGVDQLITAADPSVIAYDPTTGKVLWQAKVLSGEAGPSPVYSNGLIHVGNEYCEWTVFAPGKGDLMADDETWQKHLKWTADMGLPDTCSPLVTDELVLLMPGSSYLTCLDVKTGEMLWEYEFEYVTFQSSPTRVGDKIYLLGEIEDEEEEDEEGFPVMKAKMWILEADREGCEVVGECELGEGSVCCPAFQDGRIYIRGKKNLFCIGK